MTYRMGDAIHPENLPAGLDAYGGYVDGRWPDYQAEMQRFPLAHHLSISAFATDDADCLDIETGDATDADAPGWVARQRARGVTRPCLYTSLSNAQALIATMNQAGILRTSYRLWVAHYTNTSHTCDPNCGLGFTDLADATQWTDHGGVWDESVVADDFFPTPPPLPIREDTMIHFNDANGTNYLAGEAKDNGNTLILKMTSWSEWDVMDVTDVLKATRPNDPRTYQVT